MKRNRIYNFGEKEIPMVTPFDLSKLPEFSSPESNDNPLLDIVYSVDEKTGLPVGDLSFYMSNKTSPEVRQFIIDNLMQPCSHVNGIELSEEDALFDMVRERGETQESYLARMKKYVEVQNENV